MAEATTGTGSVIRLGVPLELDPAVLACALARGSPAWFDELTSILRSHGIDTGPPVPDELELIMAMKIVSVRSGRAFALSGESRPGQLPDSVTWARWRAI